MKCGRRGGWWGSDKRKEAGNVGGRGYRGGLVILKATREASCNGESFGSKNASHPHNPLLILWHIYIQLYQRAARSPTWLLLQGTFAVWRCLMSFSSQVDKECFLDKKEKELNNYRGSQHGVVPFFKLSCSYKSVNQAPISRGPLEVFGCVIYIFCLKCNVLAIYKLCQMEIITSHLGPNVQHRS